MKTGLKAYYYRGYDGGYITDQKYLYMLKYLNKDYSIGELYYVEYDYNLMQHRVFNKEGIIVNLIIKENFQRFFETAHTKRKRIIEEII